MAADAYVTAAAAHLQEAATALKNDADQIRADFMTYDREVTRTINTKESEMRSDTALAATSSDPEREHILLERAHQLKGEIEQLKRQHEQRRSQTDQAVKSKESTMNNLMSQSRSLHHQASSLK